MSSTKRIPSAELGARGERRACWYYRLRGYRILEKNYHTGGGEIDLVVRRGSTLAFVEVKTRQTLTAGEGYESVDARKRAQIVRLAERYLSARRDTPRFVRYDVLSLYWNGNRFEVRHFPDAFRPVSDPDRPWRWRV